MTTTQKVSHGWAYVPDIKPQLQPLESRKRGNRISSVVGSGGGAAGEARAGTGLTTTSTLAHGTAQRRFGELSIKEQKAIQARLNEIDRENYKDAHVPIPTKAKDRASKKMTSNVRRILTYQRTFVHYLADEEAQLAHASSGGGGGSGGGSSSSNNNNSGASMNTSAISATQAAVATKLSLNRARSGSTTTLKQSPMPPPPLPASAAPSSGRDTVKSAPTPSPTTSSRRKTSISNLINPPLTADADGHAELKAPDTKSSAAAPLASSQTSLFNQAAKTPTIVINDREDERNLLLRTCPSFKPPSQRVLAILVSEPALSYSASQAQPLRQHQHQQQQNHQKPASGVAPTTISPSLSSLTAKPLRHFCAICGYWGKIRCKRCPERTCGLLECWRSHDEGCFVPTY